jgi:hypothetical protein
MKSRETLIRLKKFQVDEKRRKVAQIETMIAEFERMAGDLEREPRSRPFRLSHLRQGRDRATRKPQAFGRRIAGAAR